MLPNQGMNSTRLSPLVIGGAMRIQAGCYWRLPRRSRRASEARTARQQDLIERFVMDPHFENYFNQTNEQLGQVLSYHLNLEGLLSLMIERAVPNPEALVLDRMMFARKAALCRALGLISHQEYSILQRLNGIRNRTAHRLGYRPSFEEVHAVVVEAGRAGIDFSDSIDQCDAAGARDLGYDTALLLNTLFRNTFYWIASHQDEDLWLALTG
jgi:hypothetical protein